MSGSTKAGYSVTISATDAATGTIDKINKRLAEIRRPTEQMNRSLQKFSEVSGLKSIAKDLDGVQRYALQGVFALDRMAPGMAAIAGAASVGGAAALAKSFADLAVSLTNTANAMGVTTPWLASFQAAIRLAHGDVAGATAAFQNLGDAIAKVQTGQGAAGFVQMVNSLGVQMRHADGTLKSATELMPEINDAIRHLHGATPAITAQLQRTAEGAIYGNEAMDPIIREGSAAFNRQFEDAQKLIGVTNETIAAQRGLADQIARLQESFSGLGNKITADVAPALGQVAGWMSGFIASNPGVVENITLLGVGFTTLAGTIGLVTKAAGLMPAWLIPMLARAAPILLTGPAGEVDPRSRFDQTGQPRTPTGPDPFTGLLPGAEPPLPSTWGRGFHAADLWRRYSPTTDPRLDPSSFPPNYDPSADRGDRPRLQFLRDQWTAKGDVPGGPKDADSKRATSTPAELIRAEQQGREIGRAISDWLTSHAEELARAIGGGAVRGITFTAPTTAPGVPTTAPSAPTPASGDDRPGAPEPWNVPGAEMPPQLGPKDLETVTTPGGAAWRMNRDHADYFRRFFSELEKLEGHPLVSSGGYNWRPVRGGSSPSAHAYGEAGDVDAPHNPQGNSGQTNLPPEPALRALLRRYPHIRWGGDFPGRQDRMHFEYRNLPGDRGAAGVPVSPADPAFGGHIGTSYNNPFNLDLRPGQGAIGGRSYRDAHDNSAHVMGEYATMAAGIAAAYHRLEEYQAMGLTTVRQMIDKWTGHPGANYGEALAKELGVGLDAPVDIHNQDFARRFLEHMKPHENRGELDDKDVRAALGMPSAPDLHAGGHSDGGGPHARHTADIQVTVKGRTDLAEVHATAHGNLWRGPPRVVRADVGGRIA